MFVTFTKWIASSMTVEMLTQFEEVGFNLKGPCELHLFWNMADEDVSDKRTLDFDELEPKDGMSAKLEDIFAPVKQEAEALVASSNSKLKSPTSQFLFETGQDWNENRYFEDALDRFLSNGSSNQPDYFSSSKWEAANRELRVMESHVSSCKLDSTSSQAKGLRRHASGEHQIFSRAQSLGYASAKELQQQFDLSKGTKRQHSSPRAKDQPRASERDLESHIAPPLRKRRRTPPTTQPAKKRSKTLSSKYRGVSKCSKDGRWQARIRIGAVVKYLGRFKSEIEAAKRYDIAAHKLHGERAMPNFAPDGTPNIRTTGQGHADQSASATSDVDTVGTNEE